MLGSPVVLDVGPDVIRRRDGGCEPPSEMVAAVLDGIDDPVVLLDERPVRVDDLLRSLIAQALGGRCAEVLVMHPPMWPLPRVVRILDAVRASADRVRVAADGEPVGDLEDVSPRRRIRSPLGVIGAVVSIAACAAVAAVAAHPRSTDVSPPATVITSTVTEGRVAVAVPDGWVVERLTRGPGSRRVRVSSPADPDLALHITQSYAPDSTLAEAAAVLGRAAAGRPEFADFLADDPVAGRPAVSYREIRPGRVIRWTVLLDGETRIGIGCQTRPGAEEGIRMACEQVIHSARQLAGTVPGN